MWLLFFVFSFGQLCLCASFRLKTTWRVQSQLSMARKSRPAEPSASGGAPTLLPQPPSNSVGNFIDNQSTDMSFIQCNILAMSEINGQQYGVGFPIDLPVMLTYFDNNELKPVKPDYPDYDHLINHVSVQLDNDDFQLFKTPIVLTLQGEFEDSEFNAVNPFEVHSAQDAHSDTMHSDYEDEYNMEDEVDDDKELTLEQLMLSVEEEMSTDWSDDSADLADDLTETEDSHESNENSDTDTDTDDGKDSNDNMQSFWSSPIVAASGNTHPTSPDITITRPEKFDPSEIPEESTVSAEDTRDLQRAHRKADRIMEYADDIKLIGSFHYKKRNYHLVRLLEPIFVMGKRIPDIKGYFFSLLDERETEQVRPLLEELLLTKANSIHDIPVVEDNKDQHAQDSQDGRRGRRGIDVGSDRVRGRTSTTGVGSRSEHSAPKDRSGMVVRGKQPSTDPSCAGRSDRVAQTGAGTTESDDDGESRFQKARRRWKKLKDEERSA